MIEGILAWCLLIYAIFNRNPLYYVASGIFAVAAQVSRVYDKLSERLKEDNNA